MTEDVLLLETLGPVARLTLNRPKAMNSLNMTLAAELDRSLQALAADDAIHVVVLTGAGPAFCAGADLKEVLASQNLPAGELDFLDRGNTMFQQLRNFPKPLIAALNGVTMAGGLELAMCADIIVAAESAYFLQAFRRIGLVPDGGSTYLLPRLIGKARAMEMALLGDKIPAKTALEWGLVNRCVPDDQLMATAMELAKALATGPKALGAIRKLVWQSLDEEWAEQLHAERVAQKHAGRTEDSREGILAFLQKRPAAFTGR